MQHSTMDKYKIDYSRWDRMVDSDDDDGDDNPTKQQQKPQVTVFDQPTRVTFGGTNVSDNSTSSLLSSCADATKTCSEVEVSTKSSTSVNQNNSSNAIHFGVDNTGIETAATSPANSTKPIIADNNGIPLSWTENGAAIFHEQEVTKRLDFSDDNQSDRTTKQENPPHQKCTIAMDLAPLSTTTYKYFWSQDRLMIHIRIPIISNKKLKYHVNTSNLISYEDRHCATFTTDTSKQHLVVTSSLQHDNNVETATLLDGKLNYPVYVPEDYDDNEVDWSIQTCTNPILTNESEKDEIHTRFCYGSIEKYILITLYKATPMFGMTIWWKRCLTSELTDIVTINNPTGQQQQQEFQKVWDEAHQQFQKTIHAKTKHSL